MFVLANLDEERLKSIRDLEEREGIRVLALKEVAVEPAPIDAGKLHVLQEIEQELGVCLVAVQ